MQLLCTFGRKCISDDFQYEYTKCDESGKRWRVVIPKMNNFECDEVPLPIRVNCCLFSYHFQIKKKKFFFYVFFHNQNLKFIFSFKIYFFIFLYFFFTIKI